MEKSSLITAREKEEELERQVKLLTDELLEAKRHHTPVSLHGRLLHYKKIKINKINKSILLSFFCILLCFIVLLIIIIIDKKLEIFFKLLIFFFQIVIQIMQYVD